MVKHTLKGLHCLHYNILKKKMVKHTLKGLHCLHYNIFKKMFNHFFNVTYEQVA